MKRKEKNMQSIIVHNLTRLYGTNRAVNDISFSVGAGEFFGFLGPNGAGKTTTIKILTGQLRPTSGSARVAGFDVVSQRDQMKPQIGVVFEVQNLYQRLSARDNLRFSARLYGVPDGRVEQVIEMVGLKDRANDDIKKFSNGMKQRILIARAILHRPQVLFLDEPTRGLDPAMARSVRHIVKDLAAAGMTIFLTTHYMEEADQLCDRVAILDHGQVIALDTPAQLKTDYNLGAQTSLEDVFIHLTGHTLVE
jgi:ABC-2 type transport system ATP-binding protein